MDRVLGSTAALDIFDIPDSESRYGRSIHVRTEVWTVDNYSFEERRCQTMGDLKMFEGNVTLSWVCTLLQVQGVLVSGDEQSFLIKILKGRWRFVTFLLSVASHVKPAGLRVTLLVVNWATLTRPD